MIYMQCSKSDTVRKYKIVPHFRAEIHVSLQKLRLLSVHAGVTTRD